MVPLKTKRILCFLKFYITNKPNSTWKFFASMEIENIRNELMSTSSAGSWLQIPSAGCQGMFSPCLVCVIVCVVCFSSSIITPNAPVAVTALLRPPAHPEDLAAPNSGLVQQGLLFWEHSVGGYLLWHKSPGSSQCLKLIKLSLSQKEHMATNECNLSPKWAESTCKQRKPWRQWDREEQMTAPV